MTSDEQKQARDYAWEYFVLHADQRMKLFNFFLVLSGLILGAFPAVRGMAPGERAVALLPLLLVLTAFIFWRLEERTRALVKNGEDALRFLDEGWAVLAKLRDGSPHNLRLVERNDYFTDKLKARWWAKWLRVPVTYSQSFRVVYVMVGLVGALLAAWVLFGPSPVPTFV